MYSWPYSPPSHRHTPAASAVAFITTLLVVLSSLHLHAQTPVPEYNADSNQFVNRWAPSGTAAPIRPVWGCDTNEFWIGAYVNSWPSNGGAGLAVWENWWKLWSDTTGLRIVETREGLWNSGSNPMSQDTQRIDSVIMAMRPRSGASWHDRLIMIGNEVSAIGHARELVLFPFDTTNSALWQSRFLQFSGGLKTTNQTYGDHRGAYASEMYYDTSNTTPDATVAQELFAGYDSLFYEVEAPRRQLAVSRTNDSVAVRDAIQEFAKPSAVFGTGHQTVFALRGHLFAPGLQGGRGDTVGLNDTLLFVDIYSRHLIGSTFYNHNAGGVFTAATVVDYLYASLPVLKRDFVPTTSPADPTRWDRYREVVLRCDLHDTNALGVRGPFHPQSQSQLFDLRIRWTGQEKTAVRLVAVRDTLAQLLAGKDTMGNALRLRMLDWTQRLILGPNYPDLATLASLGNPAPLDSALSVALRKVIRIYTGDEGSRIGNVGFSWLDSTLYTSLGASGDMPRTDTALTHQLRTFRGQGWDATVQSSQNEIICENSYIHAPEFDVPPLGFTRQDYLNNLDAEAATRYEVCGVMAIDWVRDECIAQAC